MLKEMLVIFLLVAGIINWVKAEENMKIEMITDNGKLILTASQPVRRFRLMKDARLCEGKGFMANNFYLESPDPGSFPGDEYYVTKTEYEKDPKIILIQQSQIIPLHQTGSPTYP